MMRTKYVSHHCPECAAKVDHVQLSYVNETVLVCMICQNETVDEAEDSMRKEYIVETIRDADYHTSKRRKIVVQMKLTKSPGFAGEGVSNTEIFKAEYTAYGEDHFTASIRKHPGGGYFPHLEAKAISHEIKKFIM